MNQPILPEQFRLDIDEIDEQHTVLFHHLLTLENAVDSGDRWVVLHSTLSELSHWAQVHFAVEESLMRLSRFSGAAQHTAQHQEFLASLQRMRQQSLTEDLADNVASTLRDWLMHHILVEDRKYANHFRQLIERAGETPLGSS